VAIQTVNRVYLNKIKKRLSVLYFLIIFREPVFLFKYRKDLISLPPFVIAPSFQIKRNTFACQICFKTFNSNSNAHKHVRTHGVATEPLEDRTCPNCGVVFRYAALCRLHVKRTCLRQRSPWCETCKAAFNSKLELKEHIRKVHEDDRRRCSHCSFIAASVASLLAHEKTVHLNLKCKQCKRIFSSEAELASHECAVPEKLQCRRCDKSFGSGKELEDHEGFAHEGLKYSCQICSATLSTEKNLKRHVRAVHEILVRSFACSVPDCGKTFKDQRTAANHERTHDVNSRSDPCPDCGKILSSNDALRTHIKVVHEKDFKHVCPDCGKRFPSLSHLRTHGEMVHMQGAMLVCQLCGKTFLGKNRMRNHMQR
jgi:KRAB domain-containing zinc finger protein